MKKREIQIKELEYYNEVYSDIESIEQAVDIFIQNIYASYQVLHSEIFMKEFLTETEMKSVIKDVHKEVMTFMSRTLYQRLLLIYAPDVVQEVINKKVLLLVIQTAEEMSNNTYDNSGDIDKLLKL